MPRTSTPARAGQAGGAQQATQGSAADHDRLVLDQQLGQVAVVAAGIPATRQLDDAIAHDVGQPTRVGPAAVGMHQPGRSVRANRTLRRHTWRWLSCVSVAASATLTSPTNSFVKIQARRCSLPLMLIASCIGGD